MKEEKNRYVLNLKFKNGRQLTKKEELYIYIYIYIYKQFINTPNFTGFLFLHKKGDKTHISYLKIQNNTEGKTVYLTKGTSSQYYFLPLYS
jgi:hypothetical protein